MTNNNHPDPDNIRTIAMRLESMLPLARNEKMEMFASRVYINEELCGTQACHGGFYELEFALRNKEDFILPEDFYDNTDCEYLLKKTLDSDGCYIPVYWYDGAERMAKDLGFKDRNQLEEWANKNPLLWGNTKGRDMFQDGEAFKGDYDSVKLIDVVNHWLTVAERIEILTALKSR